MKSKVVAIRFPVGDLASSIAILDAAGLSTSGIPLSSIIRTLLQATIKQEIEKGTIRPISEANALKLIEGWKKEEVDLGSLGSKTLIDALKELNITEEIAEEPEIPDTITKLIEQMRQETQPDVEQEVVINEEVEGTPIMNRDDLNKLKRIPLEKIRTISPKDRILQNYDAMKGQADSDQEALFQLCIEVIYASLEEEKWGLESTQRMIEDLYSDYS